MKTDGAHHVYVVKPGDHQAGVDGDSINAGLLHTLRFLLQAAALTGDAVLKVFSGATAGTKTTAETFRYTLAQGDQAAANADKFAAWATSAALTLTAATYDNRLLIVEIDCQALTEGQNWVTLEIGAEASAFNAAVVAVGEARYKSQTHEPTVL